jgi:hypothetical protein
MSDPPCRCDATKAVEEEPRDSRRSAAKTPLAVDNARMAGESGNSSWKDRIPMKSGDQIRGARRWLSLIANRRDTYWDMPAAPGPFGSGTPPKTLSLVLTW